MNIALYAGILAVVFVASVAASTVALAQSALAAFHEDTTDNATSTMNQIQTAADNRVEVGRGSNLTVQYYTYSPQTIEIDAGESVTWYAKSEFVDIHTVTFVQDNTLISDLILPFTVPEGAEFELAPPFNLGEPVTIETPDGEAIVAINKHVFYPAVVDASGETTFLNETETIQYMMDGTEKALNCGIILPPFPPEAEQNETAMEETPAPANATDSAAGDMAVQEGPPLEPPFPLVSEFIVTFEQPGTYPYFCSVHPWMTSQLVVAGGNQTEES